jgi:hypothetical protein
MIGVILGIKQKSGNLSPEAAAPKTADTFVSSLPVLLAQAFLVPILSYVYDT